MIEAIAAAPASATVETLHHFVVSPQASGTFLQVFRRSGIYETELVASLAVLEPAGADARELGAALCRALDALHARTAKH